MTEFIQVVTTVASLGDAKNIAGSLVRARLAACVQISGAVQSYYHWQGQLESAEEYVLTIKSRQDLFPDLCGLIEKLHPYEVPEILSFPIAEGATAYLAWLDKELQIKK